MDQIQLRAHAKINLTLDVVGRRPDGYHLLESIMQSISLADLVTLRKRERGIELRVNNPCLPSDDKNICWQAASLFQEHTGLLGGVQIELNKGIPLNAGLGGGSADAAAVLYGLNELYDTQLTLAELQSLGLKIGADVPFCLQGGTAFVEGIGEQVTALDPLQQVSIIVVKPEEGVSTAKVYGRLSPLAHGGESSKSLLSHMARQAALESLGNIMTNALESVTIDLVPEVQIWKERLLASGAFASLMSGSGTTVFGLFDQAETAREFQSAWCKTAKIFLVQPVPRGVVKVNGGD